jgi:cytochrome c oxidase subunit III
MAEQSVHSEGGTHWHPPHLQHHFDNPGQQYESVKLGMWVFLATELLFFGGLFVAYAVYRANHPEIFVYAHQFLDAKLGGLNTVVLIFSSFTMAWAVRCAQLGKQKGLVVLLSITLLCAFIFLGVKAVEYEHKWKHGLLWGKLYDPVHEQAQEAHGEPALSVESNPDSSAPDAAINTEEQSAIAPAAVGPRGLAVPDAEGHGTHGLSEPDYVHIFFGIYFAMTGLHGLHVIIGIGVIFWLLLNARKGRYNQDYYTPVDLVGLYWHLVDLIWIYLFPLFYLIG